MKVVYIVLLAITFSIHCNGQADSTKYKQIPDSNGVYTFVEQRPQFPGGDSAMSSFFGRNLRFHVTKKEQRCDYIAIRIIVDADGKVINPVVLKSCGRNLDEEYLNVFRRLPKFKPARQNGQAVKAYFEMFLKI